MNLLKRTKKLLGKWVFIPVTQYYLSQERKVTIDDIHLKIPVGVFHPTLFLSTKFLLEWVDNQMITDLKTLELGAGSGLLSIAMAKRRAIVTASDISQLACAAVRENAQTNNVSIKVIYSDLFEEFTPSTFDLILINPPYYPKNPQNEAEKAWFCGDNFDYFQKLFAQLADFMAENGRVMMVLSEDCNYKRISQSAHQNGFHLQQVAKKRSRGEWNYLFALIK